MSKIELIRVDFRMIHGQVMVKWLKATGAQIIAAVNDDIANDPFLADIYGMAAPSNVDIKVFTKDKVIDYFNNNNSDNSKVLVLFKNVKDAHYCYEKGFPMEHLQIGGLGSGPDRINVHGPITLNAEDAKLLKDMNDKGVKIEFQQVPDDSKASLDKILKKYDFGLN
ncbi:PTS sugar transporter subunit IIB [Paratissierella segnis]|uniref:PTS sugar transporter subunit IIB n=1 Tax=Paratissierella segnis TaxID=2763679 RepID=A0A926IIL3_9FIRM|nr:PTS sugar transporter subunit IIB [Paratissierella segnis]MBC8587084.1 PTS sugar transporter subunit IIB [Paratissierella segnis]